MLALVVAFYSSYKKERKKQQELLFEAIILCMSDNITVFFTSRNNIKEKERWEQRKRNIKAHDRYSKHNAIIIVNSRFCIVAGWSIVYLLYIASCFLFATFVLVLNWHLTTKKVKRHRLKYLYFIQLYLYYASKANYYTMKEVNRVTIFKYTYIAAMWVHINIPCISHFFR